MGSCLDADSQRSIGLIGQAEAGNSLFYFQLQPDDGMVHHQDTLYERLVHYAVTLSRFLCMYEIPVSV